MFHMEKASKIISDAITPLCPIWHFAYIMKCIFFDEKFCILIQILLKFVPNGPIDSSTVSGKGLVPNGRQAITWTNADPVYCRIYATLGDNELI